MRMPLSKPVLLGSPILIAFMILGWFGGTARPLFGSPWVTRAVIWALAGIIAFVAYRLLRRPSSTRSAPAAPDAMDRLFSEAGSRLAAGGLSGRRVFGDLPVVLILGPHGSTKTSAVLHSGLETEHLAGNLFYGGAVARTDAVNLWFHDRHLLVEAGGQLVVEPKRWSSLIRRLRPRRGPAHLFGQPQAPRIAVVCFSCEELLRPGGQDAVLAAASNLRSRLVEYSEEMGVRIPVYVVFTKADAMTHFTAFAEPLTNAEASELLGATLPVLEETPAGAFADVESQRLSGAFETLVHGLAKLRLDMLGRVQPGAAATEAYEFPRQFGKIAAQAVPFLVELCRPGQLPRLSPFLRGFYFIGVRPVLQSDSAAPAARPGPMSLPAAAGATQVLDARLLQAAAPPAPAPEHGAQRIPQWVFLRRLFGGVFLADHIALGMSRSGAGLRVFRRAILTALLASAGLAGVIVIGSYLRDRSLQRDVRTALVGVDALGPVDPARLSMEEADRLDALRQVTASLSRYENGRRPFRSLYGLYTGRGLYAEARRVYLERLESVLLDPARADIERTLAPPFPASPTLDEFDRIYNALKVTVELTESPDRAEGDFFRSTLTSHWEAAASGTVDGAVRDRVGEQFRFLAGELRYGNPWDVSLELDYRTRVATTRDFLRDNLTASSFYASLVAQSNRLPSVLFAREYPDAATDVIDDVEVPGSFTRQGWDSIQAILADPGQFLSRDLHVVGEEFFVEIDVRALTSDVQSRYLDEYERRWIEFLEAGGVQNFGFRQTPEGLQRLAGNQSPLFRLFGLAARHTNLADPDLDAVFRPIHEIVPDSIDRLWTDLAAPYVQNLGKLAVATELLVEDTGPASVEAVNAASLEARNSVAQIGQSFPAEPPRAASVGSAVLALMRRPIDEAAQLARAGPAVVMNEAWARVCRQNEPVLRRFPFDSNADQQATIEDVDLFLHPDNGRIWTFHTEFGADPSLNRRYAEFIRTAELIRDALYEDGGSSPSVRFQFQALTTDVVTEAELGVGGDRFVYTPTRALSETVQWDGGDQIELRIGGITEPLTYRGIWSIFELLNDGEWIDVAGGQEVTWTFLDGRRVTAALAFRGGENIFRPGYLDDFRCPSGIAGE